MAANKVKWKTRFLRILFYGIFVFLSIVLVLALRKASLIWIHHQLFGNPWSNFESGLHVSILISAIQTAVMLLCTLVYSLIRRTCSLRHIAGATLLLCILDLFIRPIGIWTRNYQIICPALTIGAILVFPLFAWLVLFLLPINRNPANRGNKQIPPMENL
jgi:hypothetical protein